MTYKDKYGVAFEIGNDIVHIQTAETGTIHGIAGNLHYVKWHDGTISSIDMDVETMNHNNVKSIRPIDA